MPKTKKIKLHTSSKKNITRKAIKRIASGSNASKNKKHELNDLNEMNKIKIVKFLGQGIIGKVYLVSINNAKRAMKIEYIPSKNYSFLNTELEFMKEVGNKYPDQFMQLYNYDFIENCKETYPEMSKWLTAKQRKKFTELRNSGLCVRKIYSLVDKTLNTLPLAKLTIPKLYSIMIQIIYITHLMHSKDFVHGDFHHGNIGIINVNKNKTIEILGYNIPTFGIQLQAIDYGGMLNKKTLSKTKPYQQWDDTELSQFNDSYIREQTLAIDSMINDSKYWEFRQENGVPISDYKDDLKLILAQDEIKDLKKLSKNNTILFTLYCIFYPVKFQKILLGKYYKKYIPYNYYIPIEDIIYSYINYDKPETLIKYFANKL